MNKEVDADLHYDALKIATDAVNTVPEIQPIAARIEALAIAYAQWRMIEICDAARCQCGHFACAHIGPLYRGVYTCESCECRGFTEPPRSAP